MKKVYTVFFILILQALIITACDVNSLIHPRRYYCRTRYPVLLVHGFGLKDNVAVVNYWGDVAKILRKKGTEVYVSTQDAYNSHENNARQLQKQINQILKQSGADKINLIAHSKGGIESRYLITELGMADKVSSLTTLSTPHRGTIIADIVLNIMPVSPQASVLFQSSVNTFGKMIGDSNPDTIDATEELTLDYMKKFNERVTNMPGVYYQSYSAAIENDYPNLLWLKMAQIHAAYSGPNDGIVAVKSAIWGNYRGQLRGEKYRAVSHFDMIGKYSITGVEDFDIEDFYSTLVHELKEKGF